MASKQTKKASRAKKPRIRKQQSRQTGVSVNLPEPIEINAMRGPAKPEEKPGLLGQLGSLFSGADNPSATSMMSSAESGHSSAGSIPDPLSRESEQILSSVPDHIGGEADDPGGPGDVSMHEDIDADSVREFMAEIVFENQDIHDLLVEFFDWIAEKRQMEHWRLTERQARMLGRPLAQLLNSLWIRLQNYLPETLAGWCEDIPGATGFILACGLVPTPKIFQDVRILRERAKLRAKSLVREQSRSQPIRPAPKPASGIVFDGEGGQHVPVSAIDGQVHESVNA